MGLSPWEIIMVALVVVLLFGTKRLPELGSGLGKAISNFRQSFKDGQAIDVTPRGTEKTAEEKLVQPTFLTEFPRAVSPLARANDTDPAFCDRFELFVNGKEIANGFSELNDPDDQRSRFAAQIQAKQAGADETMDYDEDYCRALEVGLPPTAGEGIGIDRLAMLLTGPPSIRDVILFPLMRPE